MSHSLTNQIMAHEHCVMDFSPCVADTRIVLIWKFCVFQAKEIEDI